MSLEERFWSKVHKAADGCWLWTGSCMGRGYGYLHTGGHTVRRPVAAHRVSWMIHNGPIPNGKWVLHRCDTPPCVNPDHLFLGSRTDNMRDAAKKGRIVTIGQRRKTECKHGHAYTPSNTHRNKYGHRVCRACWKRYRIAAAIRARGK